MSIVSFVILHYKDRTITDTCVQSILRMEQQERIRIVVVDNDVNEEESIRKKLKDLYSGNPRIAVLQVQENGGFSYANNLGYHYAREKQGASCILVLNNDIEFPQPEFLKLLDNSLKKHSCHILGPNIIRQDSNEPQNPMDTRIRTMEEAAYTVRMNRLALRFYPATYPLIAFLLWRSERAVRKKKKENAVFYQNVQENIVPFGACLIFTPEFVQKEEKAFCPETKFFYEEYILALRCQKKGYRIVYDPSMTINHETGAATKQSFRGKRKRLRFVLERTVDACEIYMKFLKMDG
ncbi:MAG: glycosyltransferase [Lachnospiraceae bacterium]|nr:glycosyltransferase [Lachnospiraceae bacterium]